MIFIIMKLINKKCLTCDTDFEARLSEHNRGGGNYCSLSCSSKKIRNKEPNVTCSYCLDKFYKSKSKINKSKSGLVFCCREHKDLAQKLNSGITGLQPSHYGTGITNYRKIAFENKELKCNRCGYDKHQVVLHVHHIDRDRTNSHLDNLEILCPTCHEVDHFLNSDGRYRANK